MHLLVISDYDRAVAVYRDVLGATIARQMPAVLAFLDFGGGQLIVSVAGGPTADTPSITFQPPASPLTVTSEVTFRVPDRYAAYDALRARGAVFLTGRIPVGDPCLLPGPGRAPDRNQPGRRIRP